MNEMRVKLPEGGEVIIKGKYVGGGILLYDIAVPTLEGTVNKLYSKYMEISKKDRLVEEGKDIVRSMGINDIEVDYDPYGETATIKGKITDNEMYNKIQEIVRYLVGSWCYGDYWLIVTNKEPDIRRYADDVKSKAKELGLLDFGTNGYSYWLKIAEINGKLDKWYAYLVV